jgi:hypothetical protein
MSSTNLWVDIACFHAALGELFQIALKKNPIFERKKQIRLAEPRQTNRKYVFWNSLRRQVPQINK